MVGSDQPEVCTVRRRAGSITVTEPTTRTTTTTGTDGPAADALLRTGRFFTRRKVSDDLRAVYHSRPEPAPALEEK
jgi:hypothetical protein